MPKPILSLKKKNPEIEMKSQIQPEEIPANPLTATEVVNWDYIPEEEFVPRRRKRRKDRNVEQYRNESRWQ